MWTRRYRRLVHVLKRKYEYYESGKTIKMGEKCISKLVELLNVEKKKPRTTQEATGYEEDSPELAGE